MEKFLVVFMTTWGEGPSTGSMALPPLEISLDHLGVILRGFHNHGGQWGFGGWASSQGSEWMELKLGDKLLAIVKVSQCMDEAGRNDIEVVLEPDAPAALEDAFNRVGASAAPLLVYRREAA